MIVSPIFRRVLPFTGTIHFAVLSVSTGSPRGARWTARAVRGLARVRPGSGGSSAKLNEALSDDIRMRYTRFLTFAHQRKNSGGEGYTERIRLARGNVGSVKSS